MTEVWALYIHTCGENSHTVGLYASEDLARQEMIALVKSDFSRVMKDLQNYYEGDPIPEEEIPSSEVYDPKTVKSLCNASQDTYYLKKHTVIHER